VTSLPIFFFQINSLIIIFFFGIYPGLFSLIISLPIIFYFFSEPFFSFSGIEAGDIRIIVVYTVYTIISGIFIEMLRRSQYSHRMDVLVNKTLSKLMIEQSIEKSKKAAFNRK
jgi:K+-sensing histidine kinase KdpD